MKFKRTVEVLISVFLLLVLAKNCFAGFGVSPPWVRNYNLLPGSHFEQMIGFSRSKPDSDLTAKVILELPDEIKDWISIKEGLEFPLPKGEMSVAMTVIVDVPGNAELGKYKGTIKVEAVPRGTEPGVSVVLAAGVQVDLEVTGKEVEGMIIRYVNIQDVEEGSPINLLIKIENTGNVRTKPDRVYAEIFDQYHQKLLTTSETQDLDWIPSFTTKGIVAKLPAKLERGTYWAEFKIFKEDQILREGKIAFEVIKARPKPPSPVKEDKKIIYIGIGAGLALLVAVVLLILTRRKRKKLQGEKRFLKVPKRIKIGKIEIKVGDTEENNKKKEE